MDKFMPNNIIEKLLKKAPLGMIGRKLRVK